jgi:hypothetical protein
MVCDDEASWRAVERFSFDNFRSIQIAAGGVPWVACQQICHSPGCRAISNVKSMLVARMGPFFLCADEDRVRGTNDRRMPGPCAPAVAHSPKIEASGDPEQ